MVKSVRLACLMCAASVYPEPGSNSLVFGILISINILFKLSLLAHLIFKNYLVILCITAWSFKGFYCLLFNVLFKCPRLSSRTILIILPIVYFVNTFLKYFLNIFLNLFEVKIKISNACVFTILLAKKYY